MMHGCALIEAACVLQDLVSGARANDEALSLT